MAPYGVAPVSLPRLLSYLRDRSQRVRIEDVTSDVVAFSKSVFLRGRFYISPLHFNIFVNDLLYLINLVNLCNYTGQSNTMLIAILRWKSLHVINSNLAVESRWFDDNEIVKLYTFCWC